MSVKPSAAMASAVFLSMFSRHRLASCGSSKRRACAGRHVSARSRPSAPGRPQAVVQGAGRSHGLSEALPGPPLNAVAPSDGRLRAWWAGLTPGRRAQAPLEGHGRPARTTSGTRKSVPETCCVRNHAWGGGAREGTPGLGPPRTPGRALCSGPGQGTARGHSPQQVAGNSPHVTVRALALQSNSGRSEPKAKSWQIQLVWRGLRLSWEGASTCAQVPPASPARKAIWLSTQSPRDLLKETKATAFLPTPEP